MSDAGAGKVFVEDLIWQNENADLIDRLRLPKILSSPKPTTFQHYLVTPEGQKEKTNWNHKNGSIRGNKFYWHRKTEESPSFKWYEGEGVEKTKSHPDEIKALLPGCIFEGKVRFENLTDEELGLLHMILSMTDKYRMKLGMGKPLGLGTIKVESSLHLQNRNDRYKKIFDENAIKWNKGIKEASINYKQRFKEYLSEKGVNFNAEKRIKELLKMLHYEEELNSSEEWLKGTRYMSMTDGEFKDRNILGKPSQINNAR